MATNTQIMNYIDANKSDPFTVRRMMAWINQGIVDPNLDPPAVFSADTITGRGVTTMGEAFIKAGLSKLKLRDNNGKVRHFKDDDANVKIQMYRNIVCP